MAKNDYKTTDTIEQGQDLDLDQRIREFRLKMCVGGYFCIIFRSVFDYHETK